VDGKLTKVRPQHDLVVAFITVRHASAGQLAVRITSGNHLEWLHDVDIEDPADDQILAYDETAGLWKNIDIPESAAVISSATPPANTTAIWFNTENGNTYIYYDDFWTSIAGSSGAPIISDTAPTDPVLGTQWFNSSTGKSYLYFSNAWIEIDSNGTSTASTGNAIINGGFDIWQRGTSIVPAFVYTANTADRWNFIRGGFASGTTVSRQSAGLTGFQYAARIQRDSGNTSTASMNFTTTLETSSSIPFAGNSITLSFYARAGANYSSTGSILTTAVGSGTGIDQNGQTGLTGFSTVISQQNTLTTSWQRFIVTGTPATSATQLAVYFNFNPTGTAGANDWFEVTGVQLEAGTVATPFRRNAPSIQAELAACQRYFQVLGSNEIFGSTFSTTQAYFSANFSVTMRASASATLPATGSLNGFFVTGGKTSATAPGAWLLTSKSMSFTSTGYSGLTANDFAAWTGGNIQLSAEL
jgi:hypothetical protein